MDGWRTMPATSSDKFRWTYRHPRITDMLVFHHTLRPNKAPSMAGNSILFQKFSTASGCCVHFCYALFQQGFLAITLDRRENVKDCQARGPLQCSRLDAKWLSKPESNIYLSEVHPPLLGDSRTSARCLKQNMILHIHIVDLLHIVSRILMA